VLGVDGFDNNEIVPCTRFDSALFNAAFRKLDAGDLRMTFGGGAARSRESFFCLDFSRLPVFMTDARDAIETATDTGVLDDGVPLTSFP